MSVELGTDRGERLTALGLLIKRLRQAAGWTQEELAERANVSTRLISELERGSIHRPRRDTIQLLADGLGLTGADRESFVTLARGWSVAAHQEPARQAAGPPSQLPIPPTRLVGRVQETAEATAILFQPATRLLTLTGPGGVGKTRLALELAARARAAFPDGVSFVDLSLVDAPALVLPALALALGLRDRKRQDLNQMLTQRLRDQRRLIILDNFEHVVAAAPAVADLLTTCCEICLLVTSREPLRVRAERQYAVTPLPLPDLGGGAAVGELARNPAVDLFVDRARAVDATFALTAENAPAVADIVTQLDGVPLAIELAAARIKVLSPGALQSRLEHRLPLLTGGALDLPARQQTMRSTISWSHDLLSPEERWMFRRLAVFDGGFGLEAAAALLPGTGGAGPDLIDGLTSLLDKSLLRRFDDPAGQPRFGMLETIREHGLEHLAAEDDERDARIRHAAWCIALVEQRGREPAGPGQEAWFARLEIELPNIRSALRWSLGRDEAETAMRLAGTLYRFWAAHGLSPEGEHWLEQVLTIGVDGATTPRANTLLGAGVMAFVQGAYRRANELWHDAWRLYDALGDAAGVAYTLGNLGLIADVDGDYVEATAKYDEALALFRQLDDQVSAGFMLRNLGLVACFAHDFARAKWYLQESLTMAQAMGDRNSQAMSLGDLGLVAFGEGRFQEATALQIEALTLGRPLHYKLWLVRSIENFALIAAATSRPGRAGRLFGAAAARRAEYGAAAIPKDHALFQRYIAVATAQLGVEAFDAEWAAGGAMTLDESIAYALVPAAAQSE